MHNGWLLSVKVTRSSTIEVRRVVYTVPSRLIGERARSINYHHVIRSLVAKPHEFRYSQIRDDLLPSNIYRQLRPDKIVDVEQNCR